MNMDSTLEGFRRLQNGYLPDVSSSWFHQFSVLPVFFRQQDSAVLARAGRGDCRENKTTLIGNHR